MRTSCVARFFQFRVGGCGHVKTTTGHVSDNVKSIFDFVLFGFICLFNAYQLFMAYLMPKFDSFLNINYKNISNHSRV